MRLERGEDVNGRMCKVRDIVTGNDLLKEKQERCSMSNVII